MKCSRGLSETRRVLRMAYLFCNWKGTCPDLRALVEITRGGTSLALRYSWALRENPRVWFREGTAFVWRSVPVFYRGALLFSEGSMRTPNCTYRLT